MMYKGFSSFAAMAAANNNKQVAADMVSQLESSYVPMTDFPIAAIPREEPVVLSNHTTEMEEVVARTNGEVDNDDVREEEDAGKCIDITTEEVVVKRKRGRPPKNRRGPAAPKRPPPPPIIGPDGVIQKRGRGRPKKIVSEVEDGSLKGGMSSQAMRDEAQKRKRAPSARGRGRPRKYPRAEDVKKISKEKMAASVDGEAPKRGRGRPPKSCKN